MPSEHIVAVQDAAADVQQPQTKFCSLCHTALSEAAPVLHPLADALVCPRCRDGIRSTRQPRTAHILPLPTEERSYRLGVDGSAPNNNVYRQLRAHNSPHEAPTVQTTRRHQDGPHSQAPQPYDAQLLQLPPTIVPSATAPTGTCYAGTGHPFPIAPAATSPKAYQHQLPPLAIGAGLASNSTSGLPGIPTSTKVHAPSTCTAAAGAYFPPTQPTTTSLLLQTRRPQPTLAQSVYESDPWVDITRLRIRPQAHQCLYPGATFEGTQKSGRNSYDVTVTIVDVDFSMSTLCGYLCIRGLTEDWPELTTYFDAEIIGPRYGFRTRSWGASENEDQVHWARFPAYKHVRTEAKGPHMTIDDRDRGAVFMRWKERFLVPDHRVHDINGASFAGFYYVCVDFNSHAGALATEDEEAEAPISPPDKDSRRRRGSSAARNGANRSKSRPRLAPLTPPVATMSGFYYHQNSEPYQQLSLTHVAESTSTSFEFR